MKTEIPQYGDEYEPQPKFTFLGQYKDEDGRCYDLWYGPDIAEPTLIARYGPEGGQYKSGLPFGWVEDNPASPLVVARKKAEERGLDVRRDYYAGKMKRRGGVLYHNDSTDWIEKFQRQTLTPLEFIAKLSELNCKAEFANGFLYLENGEQINLYEMIREVSGANHG